LIQEGQTVLAYVAAVKRINGRRYLDPLKGFLIDKKNQATQLNGQIRTIYNLNIIRMKSIPFFLVTFI
jgi:hypothetical protein